jgi:hypothetical protein
MALGGCGRVEAHDLAVDSNLAVIRRVHAADDLGAVNPCLHLVCLESLIAVSSARWAVVSSG